MHPVEPYLRTVYRPAEVRALVEFLDAAGTFRFPALPNGLFSAAIATSQEQEYTGYASVWLRDNVHIAHMFQVLGRSGEATRNITALTQFLQTQLPKLDAIVCGRVKLANCSPQDEAMARPHVRFRGADLAELPESWAHAQNDALGYWMWLYCRQVAAGWREPTHAELSLLAAFVEYWATLRFWADEDSGHWEEARKISASSIGVATAGLTSLRRMLETRPDWAAACRFRQTSVFPQRLDELVAAGQAALAQILPYECRQPDPAKQRRYDAALLFLIYPLNLVSGSSAEQIVRDVSEHLLGPHGIRRYLGDSYWCQDYRDLLSAEVRTSDFSLNNAARDRLLKPGYEAQWCLFDPLLSVIHGQAYQRTHEPERLQLQTWHLNRALRQLTGGDGPFPPLRCPESYYCCAGRYVPNDITPLLWTQANLRLALHWAEATAAE